MPGIADFAATFLLIAPGKACAVALSITLTASRNSPVLGYGLTEEGN